MTKYSDTYSVLADAVADFKALNPEMYGYIFKSGIIEGLKEGVEIANKSLTKS